MSLFNFKEIKRYLVKVPIVAVLLTKKLELISLRGSVLDRRGHFPLKTVGNVLSSFLTLCCLSVELQRKYKHIDVGKIQLYSK